MADLYNFRDPIDTDIESIGGDPLAGSGFETEETEPDFDGCKGAEE